METILFWLAIPLGFMAIPIGMLGFALLPFALVSLFNEFAASRETLFSLFGIVLATSLPPIRIWCGVIWKKLDNSESNTSHAQLLGCQMLSSALTIAYLYHQKLIGTPESSWLLLAYWFICLVELWSGFFLVVTQRLLNREG